MVSLISETVEVKFCFVLFCDSDVAEWIGDQWRDLGPAALGLDPSDLERINLDSIEEMLDEFGTFKFSKSQAQALIKAAKKAWDESGKNRFDVCFHLIFLKSFLGSQMARLIYCFDLHYRCWEVEWG